MLDPQTELAVRGRTWIVPDWPAPEAVCAVSTSRRGGLSERPYDSLNLAEHVGDRPEHVRANRARLRIVLRLAHEPLWLRQVHGCGVTIAGPHGGEGIEADAACTDRRGLACVVQTADCLPVLFCDGGGTTVAAAHAGWRGLAAGVLEATLERMSLPPEGIFAWLGPAIGPAQYEVGEEVRQAFLRDDPGAEQAFQPGVPGRWWADLFLLARRRLAACGVRRVFGGHWCTYSDARRFFSHRRDGGSTGRMATLIWLR